MPPRLLVASLGLTLAASVAACASSGRYGTPAYTGAAVGLGAVGAVASRAAGGCYAQCIAGTRCDRATGLCVPGEPTHAPASPVHSSGEGHAPLSVMSSSYAAGHEYEVPPSGAVDAGCAPTSTAIADADALTCEMEGGAL
jgi:hypothetical protein